MVGRFRRDEQGASPLASFTVALGLFSLSFSAILLMVAEVGGHQSGTDLQKSGEAAGVIDLLVGTPGSPTHWQGSVPGRLGLLKTGSSATMDHAKVASLRDWTTPTQYDDARTALGIPDRELFIRTAPTYLDGAADGALASYRVGYVADYQGVARTAAANREVSALTNLSVAFTDALADRTGQGLPGDVYQDTTTYTTRQLPLRLAGFPGSLDMDTGQPLDGWWKVVRPDTQGWPGALPQHGSNALPHVLTLSTWTGSDYTYAAFGSGSAPSEDVLMLGTFDLRAYDSKAKITLDFSHYANGHSLTGVLNPLTDDYGFLLAWCVESCRTGHNFPAVHGGNHYNNGTVSAFATGSVNLSYYHGEKVAVALVWHSILATQSGRGWFLGPLTVNVAPQTGSPTPIWSNGLDYRTSLYDGLVVGSGVDQASLDDTPSGAILVTALREWMEQGGHVFAFGSASLSNGWLPTFTAPGSPQVAGPADIGASDLGHPVLNTPNRVRPGDLIASTPAYNPTANLRSVVVAPAVGGGHAPLLTVSRPSASYDGVAVLTSYLPHALPPATLEAFLVNSFLFAEFHELYADFGAPTGVPYGGAVNSETRTILVDASRVGLGVMESSVTAFVW